jgi:hypothetical protein
MGSLVLLEGLLGTLVRVPGVGLFGGLLTIHEVQTLHSFALLHQLIEGQLHGVESQALELADHLLGIPWRVMSIMSSA